MSVKNFTPDILGAIKRLLFFEIASHIIEIGIETNINMVFSDEIRPWQL